MMVNGRAVLGNFCISSAQFNFTQNTFQIFLLQGVLHCKKQM